MSMFTTFGVQNPHVRASNLQEPYCPEADLPLEWLIPSPSASQYVWEKDCCIADIPADGHLQVRVRTTGGGGNASSHGM